MNEKSWFTVRDAANHAGVSTDTIYSACEKQELRHTKIGGRRAIRIRTEWIDQWLERHATQPVSNKTCTFSLKSTTFEEGGIENGTI